MLITCIFFIEIHTKSKIAKNNFEVVKLCQMTAKNNLQNITKIT